MVHFVGAGPGAEDLITLRGMKYIEQADVIIYAGSLVNPELLKYAKENCEIHDSAYMNLEEVLQVMMQAEEKGYDTVRLHTGDGAIYGAIREQMDELRKHNISFDVCPGVSSFLGAAASLQLEYTLPEVSQSVIITRAEGRTPVPERESLRSFAAHHATMVLFLSSSLAEKVCRDLMDGGYEGDTPVAVVYKATWPEEQILRTTLVELPKKMKEEKIFKTALIIVGDVLGEKYSKSKLYDATFTTEFRKGTENQYLVIACSKAAYEKGLVIKQQLEREVGTKVNLIVKTKSLPELQVKEPLGQILEKQFHEVSGIIFLSAMGIAVRAVAPHLKHKSVDPGVVVMDETGKHVISLVSGHYGGGNELAIKVAEIFGADPVITTATDCEMRFAVDEFARQNHLVITDWKKAKEISRRILEGENIRIRFGNEWQQESLTRKLFRGLESSQVFIWNNEDLKQEVLDTEGEGKQEDVIVDYHIQNSKALHLIPKCLILGIGCKKGTPEEKIEHAVKEVFDEYQLCMEAVKQVASIDLKKEEMGLLAFCRQQELPFMTYGEEELQQVEGTFTSSSFVQEVTGVDNVCERSAMMAGTKLLVTKQRKDGVTVAVAFASDYLENKM